MRNRYGYEFYLTTVCVLVGSVVFLGLIAGIAKAQEKAESLKLDRAVALELDRYQAIMDLAQERFQRAGSNYKMTLTKYLKDKGLVPGEWQLVSTPSSNLESWILIRIKTKKIEPKTEKIP